MSGETVVTIIGNLTADPELRFTQDGAAVANFTIASTPRKLDRASGDWVDGETLFLQSSIWRDYAENVAATLRKGSRVIAVGTLRQDNWEDKEGNKRTTMRFDVDEIGPGLRYATAEIRRNARPGQVSEGAWVQPDVKPSLLPEGWPAAPVAA